MTQKRRMCKRCGKSREYYRKTIGDWRCPWCNISPKIKDMKKNKKRK